MYSLCCWPVTPICHRAPQLIFSVSFLNYFLGDAQSLLFTLAECALDSSSVLTFTQQYNATCSAPSSRWWLLRVARQCFQKLGAGRLCVRSLVFAVSCAGHRCIFTRACLHVDWRGCLKLTIRSVFLECLRSLCIYRRAVL